MLTGHILDNRPIIPVVVGWKLNLQEIIRRCRDVLRSNRKESFS